MWQSFDNPPKINKPIVVLWIGDETVYSIAMVCIYDGEDIIEGMNIHPAKGLWCYLPGVQEWKENVRNKTHKD